MGISIWMTRHTLFSGAVALHDTVLEDERHLRNLLLTKKQDQPPSLRGNPVLTRRMYHRVPIEQRITYRRAAYHKSGV